VPDKNNSCICLVFTIVFSQYVQKEIRYYLIGLETMKRTLLWFMIIE